MLALGTKRGRDRDGHTKKINAGLDYYSSVGPVGNFDPLYEQEQQIVPAVDLNVSPKWEFNFGVGVGVTHGTDHLLVKMAAARTLSLPVRHTSEGLR